MACWRNGALSVTLAVLYLTLWLFLSCAAGVAVLAYEGSIWLRLGLALLPLLGTLANVAAPVAAFISRRATFGPDGVVITQLFEQPLTIPYAEITYVEKSRSGDIYIWGATAPATPPPQKRKSKRVQAHVASRSEHVLYHMDRFTFWDWDGLGRAIAVRAGKPFRE